MPSNPFQGSGPPVAKFENDGDSVAGRITQVEYRDDTDIDGNVKTFDDGRPRPCVVVHLDVNGEPARDFVNGRSVTLFRQKVWAVEGDNQEPKVGAEYSRTMTGRKAASKRGYSPEKVFEITYSNTPDDRGDLV